jgi:hypothetical protein
MRKKYAAVSAASLCAAAADNAGGDKDSNACDASCNLETHVTSEKRKMF